MKFVDPSRTWYVVRSKVRQEDRAYLAIKRAGFDVYLPIVREERKNRRTKTFSIIEKPLMPGYLFVGFATFAKHFGMVRGCEGVLDFLGVQGEPIPIPSKAVEDLQIAETHHMFDDTREARIARGEEERTRRDNVKRQFAKGKSVKVSDSKHPFAEFQAVVDEVTSSGSVKALIDLFGRATIVEFSAAQLTPAA